MSPSEHSQPAPGPPPIPLGPHFDSQWGVAFIAFTFNAFFYGIATLLVLQYFVSKHGKKDPMSVKGMVLALTALGTLEEICSVKLNYKRFITHYGNLPALGVIPIESNIMLLSVYLISFTAQLFYASRIWLLTRKLWQGFAIVTLALLQLSTGLAQVVFLNKVHLYANLQADTNVTAAIASCATTVCDILITFILCFVLHSAKTGNRRSDSVVDKLNLYAINRGSITAAFALCTAVTFVASKTTFIFMIFQLPGSQLYVISVCSMLLNRDSLSATLHGRQSEFGPTLDTELRFQVPTISSSTIKFEDSTPGPSRNQKVSTLQWVDEEAPDTEDQELGRASNAHEPQDRFKKNSSIV